MSWTSGGILNSTLGWTLGWTLTSCVLMVFPLQAQTQSPQLSQAEPATAVPASDLSSNDEFCTARNSLQQDEQTLLGALPHAPYVVVVPGQAEEQLTVVRQCVPDAFQTDSSLGAYIRAGAFSDRRSAHQLSRHLRRSFKLNARVMYWP